SSMWRQYEPMVDMISTYVKTKGSPEQDAARMYRKGALAQMGYTSYNLVDAYAQGIIDYATYHRYWEVADQWGYPLEYTLYIIQEHVPSGLNYQVGPLINTKWNQGSPFNFFCNGYYAGCATIALAQIMRFHHYPTSFNWNNMPNTGATTDTQNLILNVGYALGLNYTTGHVGASDNDIKGAFQYFGYNYNLANHNATDVEHEIYINQRPVSMGGYTSPFGSLPVIGGDGHQWVCEGAKRTSWENVYFVEYLTGGPGSYSYSSTSHSDVPSITNPLIYGSVSYLYFYMNWGYGGTHDAWYASNDVLLPNGQDYKHLRTNFYAYHN
ncbi:MAG: C10 family peptidase, partial [Bacteroidetes bacterium]|nr:C10 family peptidase [Bacteroidota bacterium]